MRLFSVTLPHWNFDDAAFKRGNTVINFLWFSADWIIILKFLSFAVISITDAVCSTIAATVRKKETKIE